MFNQRYGRGVPRFYWDGGGVDEGGIGVGPDGSPDAGTGTGGGGTGGGGAGGGGSGGDVGGMTESQMSAISTAHALDAPETMGMIGDPNSLDQAMATVNALEEAQAANFGMDLSQTGPPGPHGHQSVMEGLQAAGVDMSGLQSNAPNMDVDALESLVSYGPKTSFLGMVVQPYIDQTDKDFGIIEDMTYGFPLSEVDASAGGDTPQDNIWDFINPPVVQPPVQPVAPVAPTTSYEDSVLFNFTPRERRNYLLNQIEMGMDPTRGYTGPDGVYVDFTAIYPDIFATTPLIPAMRGGGYVDDYRMNRGGIMNIRDEEGRVIGVQDDAADEMNRIRYHSGRDARDERFRVAARERDAREEMDRLRREARYEDVHGRGLRTFGHGGGVGSLAPVARNMFRKRRLPRAGMVM